MLTKEATDSNTKPTMQLCGSVFCSGSRSPSDLPKLPKLVYTPSVMGLPSPQPHLLPQPPLLRPCSSFTALLLPSQKSHWVFHSAFCSACLSLSLLSLRSHLQYHYLQESPTPAPFRSQQVTLALNASLIVAFITLFAHCRFVYLFSSSNLLPLSRGDHIPLIHSCRPNRSPIHIW